MNSKWLVISWNETCISASVSACSPGGGDSVVVRLGSGAGPSVLTVEPEGKEPVDAKEAEESMPPSEELEAARLSLPKERGDERPPKEERERTRGSEGTFLK
jgi:streptogramin lyase